MTHQLFSYTHVHIIGIGGIGVSAVAKLLVHSGVSVSGSDLSSGSETIDELKVLGISVHIGQDPTHIPEATDMIVYSGAVPADNPERMHAVNRGIPHMTYFAFLGEYAKGKRTIAVSGTNGKSTTTALLGLMLIEAGLDPTVIVGSKVPGFPDHNLRIGASDLFVVEACEYEAHMLYFHPDIAVITNIEEDHLDFYRDREHIVGTFQQFIDGMPEGSTLILNADDHQAFSELRPTGRFMTFGIQNPADITVERLEIAEGEQVFDIIRAMEPVSNMGTFRLRVPGMFNVSNALGAYAAAIVLGADPDACRKAMAEYSGIWRRFEYMGERNGSVIISDYAHHPSAIRGTISAAKDFYPGWRVVVCFQPHHHNRTKELFNEFTASFDGADSVYLVDIYDVAGREEGDMSVTSEALAEAISERDTAHGIDRSVYAVGTVTDAHARLQADIRPGDIVLIMGAGDIYHIAKPFASGL